MTVVEELSRRLADGEVVVIDGGMGTELQARGVPMDDEAWSGVANLTHDHVVQEIHEDYIRAGADVIIANTYAAARLPLERAGYGDRVVEANRRAVRDRIEIVRRALAQGAKTPFEIVPALVGTEELTPMLVSWGLSETLCYLRYLERREQAVRLDEGERDRWQLAEAA
jgi:methionine synthase I (cobalamin-dependent)